jgi:molybdenum cofactor biosynthesis enzyme MoaA
MIITSAMLLLESVRVRLDTGCHLRCFFCNSWQEKEARLSEAVLESVLNMSKHHGAKHVAVSGGEPLISPMLDTTLRVIQKLALPCHVTTSGIGLGEKAAALADAGVTDIHLSLESLEGKSRLSVYGESDATTILRSIDRCKDVGLNIEINYLAVRNKNWSVSDIQKLIDYVRSNELDLTVLDLLYSWNLNLEQFHIPAQDIRRDLSTFFGLKEEVIQRFGTVQTEFSCGRTKIRLRDFRARPVESLCEECAGNATHLGLTPPQISSSGMIGFCSHSRVDIGSSHKAAVTKYEEFAARLGEADSLCWQRL